MERKPRYDLLCTECGQNTAQFLLYFTKYHKEISRESVLEAELLCGDCRTARKADNRAIYVNRPNWLDFRDFALSYTQERQMRKIGFLVSKQKWEYNCLANKHWRDRIWHLRYYWNGEARVARRRVDLGLDHASDHI